MNNSISFNVTSKGDYSVKEYAKNISDVLDGFMNSSIFDEKLKRNNGVMTPNGVGVKIKGENTNLDFSVDLKTGISIKISFLKDITLQDISDLMENIVDLDYVKSIKCISVKHDKNNIVSSNIFKSYPEKYTPAVKVHQSKKLKT